MTKIPEVAQTRSGEQQGRTALSGIPPLGNVGFVGLGAMGAVMAANLAVAGWRVIAYVRRSDHFEKLKALGLTPTMDFADLLKCEVVVSMLPDDNAARDVVFGHPDTGLIGLANGLPPGAIHLSMSTIS